MQALGAGLRRLHKSRSGPLEVLLAVGRHHSPLRAPDNCRHSDRLTSADTSRQARSRSKSHGMIATTWRSAATSCPMSRQPECLPASRSRSTRRWRSVRPRTDRHRPSPVSHRPSRRRCLPGCAARSRRSTCRNPYPACQRSQETGPFM